MSTSSPKEIPLGAVRFNSDSQKLEYWMGSAWMQIQTFSPNLGDSSSPAGARGVFMGSSVPTGDSQISYVTIPTAGDAVNFGSRSITGVGANLSSRTRGLAAGDTAPTFVNTNDFITLSSTGNATDFGDRTIQTSRARGLSNQTRGCWAGGFGPSPSIRNQIDYVAIASTGNAQDFGDVSGGLQNGRAASGDSSTRGVFMGGRYSPSPSQTSDIQFITIASGGNSAKFGDLITEKKFPTGTSSKTRALCIGGATPTALTDIEYVTIATEGNATDFGDLLNARYSGAAASNDHGGLG